VLAQHASGLRCRACAQAQLEFIFAFVCCLLEARKWLFWVRFSCQFLRQSQLKTFANMADCIVHETEQWVTCSRVVNKVYFCRYRCCKRGVLKECVGSEWLRRLPLCGGSVQPPSVRETPYSLGRHICCAVSIAFRNSNGDAHRTFVWIPVSVFKNCHCPWSPACLNSHVESFSFYLCGNAVTAFCHTFPVYLLSKIIPTWSLTWLIQIHRAQLLSSMNRILIKH